MPAVETEEDYLLLVDTPSFLGKNYVQYSWKNL